MTDKPEDRLNNDFRLKLYVSFQTREDAIGLELLEALHNYCKKNGKRNFELVTRISNEGKQPRWNSAFINDTMSQCDRKALKKVWVCGPPVMSETFDRAFDNLKATYDAGTFEVL